MFALRILLSGLLVLALGTSQAQGAGSAEQNDLVQLTRSLDGLIQLLKGQQARNDRAYDLQKLEIAITYLNFRSRSVEAKERELQGLRESRDRLEDMLVELKREEDREEFRSTQPKQTTFPDRSNLSAYWRKRIDKIESEITALEIEISNLSAGLSEIESFVEKNLKLIH